MDFRFEKDEFHRRRLDRKSESSRSELDDAGFFQSAIRAIFIDRLQTSRGHANTHKLLQLRHPDTVLMQIGRENARHILRDVATDSALFLGQTTPVNDAAARRS